MCDWAEEDVVISPGVWCDPCLVSLVRALNEGGIRTVASCCGHGKQDGSICLADGRELVVRQFVPYGEAAPI